MLLYLFLCCGSHYMQLFCNISYKSVLSYMSHTITAHVRLDLFCVEHGDIVNRIYEATPCDTDASVIGIWLLVEATTKYTSGMPAHTSTYAP